MTANINTGIGHILDWLRFLLPHRVYFLGQYLYGAILIWS